MANPKSKKVGKKNSFQLTYATMYEPPAELHTRYESALKKVKANLGLEHPMIIGGKDVRAREKFDDRSPIDQDWLLGRFQKGTAEHAKRAIKSARRAFPSWSKTPWEERVRLLRKVAANIDKRVYEIAAVISLEVGKNRMEALGDIAEAADLIRYACDQMFANNGYIVPMGKDPLQGFKPRNTSILRAYGVWLIISPFNFPAALTGGPAGAALLAGNTIVMKPASDTPWTVRLLAECFRDAGLPDGVMNYVTGPGGTLGNALISSLDVDGITFTGSFDVGMHVYRTIANGPYPRPTILEMGGKNSSIVSNNADLEQAASGIVRSAFGLQGQKCSANSRIFIERGVYKDFLNILAQKTKDLNVGDPSELENFMGPIINKGAYGEFKRFTKDLSRAGSFLTGGKVITNGDYVRGFFCEPTIAKDVPLDHKLWTHEMFLPITMVHPVNSIEQAIRIANETVYGLTAGFYGAEDEAEYFFDNIEVGVCYVNRPQGSTTGAWPGYQPFGGWKGSGSSGKNAGGPYYLTLYMHEQSQTLIR
ncbi:MAG: aldehyde dehydrogenase family protein [Chloroflexi bacterium]|nr:aldehyde dehydrogenase family protein [Chloroflexota bacterium]